MHSLSVSVPASSCFPGAVQPFLNLHKNVTEVQLMIPVSEGMPFRNLGMLAGLT